MKKIVIIISLAACMFSAKAQEKETIDALRRKIDSLEQRLDEKYYTRVPNAAIDEELDKKVKESVSDWFDRNKWVNGTIFGGLIVLVGLVILTIGRRWVTSELNDRLAKNVEDKTKDIKELFTEHKTAIKDDIKDWKESVINKLGETDKNITRYKTETLENIKKLREEIYDDLEKFTQEKFQNLDQSNKDIQAEINEALDQLFAQTVESISETAQNKRKADPKAEEQIKFVLKRLKLGKIQNDTLATQALESIIQYYYYTLNTKKMDELIKEYENVYNLSSTIYANAALAFLDKYELLYQPLFRQSCLEYCEESIKKTPDYGTAYAVKLEVHLIGMLKGYDDDEKNEAMKEAGKILHQVIQMQSQYIHKELITRLDNDANNPDYMGKYIPQLEQYFTQQMKIIREKANPNPNPQPEQHI